MLELTVSLCGHLLLPLRTTTTTTTTTTNVTELLTRAKHEKIPAFSKFSYILYTQCPSWEHKGSVAGVLVCTPEVSICMPNITV